MYPWQCFIALCLGWFALPVQAQDLDVQIAESDAQGLTLLLSAPLASVQGVSGTDSRWYRVDIPGAAAKQVLGRPALPRHGVLVAIPKDAAITLTVVDAQYQDISDRAIAPSIPRQIEIDAPLWQLFDQYIDQDFYSQDALLPAAPVSVGFQGLLRDQPVAQILFHPVQINPATRMLRLYQQLRVRVDFGRPLNPANTSKYATQAMSVSAAESNSASSDPFAALMRKSLINASQAGR